MAGCAKYDTSRLRRLIVKKGLSREEFLKQVYDLTGIPQGTISQHMYGIYAPGEDEMTAWSIVLGASEDEIAPLIIRRDQSVKAKEIKKASGRKKKPGPRKGGTHSEGSMEDFDSKAFIEALKAKGLSPYKLSRKIGVSASMVEYWIEKGRIRTGIAMKILKITGIDPFKLSKTEPEAPARNELPASSEKVTPVDGELNVFEVFKIINGNLQLILDKTGTPAPINDTSLQEEIQILKESIVDLSRSVRSLSEKVDGLAAQHSSPTATVINISGHRKQSHSEVKNMGVIEQKYDESDSYEVYSRKIMRYVGAIASMRGVTTKQVLCDCYKEMTNVYGVVFDQLRKEYRDKYGQPAPSSMELLYKSGIFTGVFFNVVVSAYQNATSSISVIK